MGNCCRDSTLEDRIKLLTLLTDDDDDDDDDDDGDDDDDKDDDDDDDDNDLVWAIAAETAPLKTGSNF